MNNETWSVPKSEEIHALTHDQLTEHIRLARVNIGHYGHVLQDMETELNRRSPTVNYRCMKCGHERFELNQIRTARSWLSSYFGVESAQYQAVVCERCKFTEFHQGKVPLGQQALDMVFGS